MNRINSQRVINLHCGMGRDSITMICLAAEGRLVVQGKRISLREIDAVVFADTGCEWPHTYQLLERVAVFVVSHGGRFVVLRKAEDVAHDELQPRTWAGIEYKARGGAYHYRPAILDDFQSRATVASLGKGDCTDNHKIQPLRRFMSDQHRLRFGADNAGRGRQIRKGLAEPSLVLIGIAADEQSRLVDEKRRSVSYVEECYPLVEMGITKAGETAILAPHGFEDVRKSGCYMCPYQPASWWWALRESQPGAFWLSVNYENTSLKRNPRMNVTGLREPKKAGGAIIRLPVVVERWRKKNPHAQVNEVLDKQYSRCNAEARAMKRAEAEEL